MTRFGGVTDGNSRHAGLKSAPCRIDLSIEVRPMQNKPNSPKPDATPVPFLESRDGAGTGPNRRESVVDRRAGLDRRHVAAEEAGYEGPERRTAEDRRDDTGLERRRGPGRRRSDDRRSAEEGEMSAEQFEFVMAIETYKKVNKRMY